MGVARRVFKGRKKDARRYKKDAHAETAVSGNNRYQRRSSAYEAVAEETVCPNRQ